METPAAEVFPWTWNGLPPAPTQSPYGECARAAALTAVAGAMKALLRAGNTVHATPEEHARLVETVTARAPGAGLLTVSNHRSTLDDPGLWSALLPLRFFASEGAHGQVRWVLCANDVCHKSRLLRDFFLLGKTLPVVRGGGTQQPVLGLLADRLAAGDWVHIFPEGKISADGRLSAMRLGTAYMLCRAAQQQPPGAVPTTVLPLYHLGMERVIPPRTRLPGTGQDVTVVVGEPLDMRDLLSRCGKRGVDQAKLHGEITRRIGAELERLERIAQARHAALGGEAAAAAGGVARS